MTLRRTLAASIVAFGAFGISAASAADNLTATYFEVPNQTPGNNSGNPASDFGTCCSSPPATFEDIAVGSALVGGMPAEGALGNINDVVIPSGEILWWTPGTWGPASDQVISTGSGNISFNGSFSSSMFAPSSTGLGNDDFYETAILSGTIYGTGAANQSITVDSDDDALVYINGLYAGGYGGVTGGSTETIDLSTLNGAATIDVFYADRARTGAFLDFSLNNLTTGVPEPATWAMFLLGFGAIGFTLRANRRKLAVA